MGDMRFQKIFGLYCVEHHRVEKWSCKVGSGRVLWVWVVYMGGQTSGDVTDAGRTTTMGGNASHSFSSGKR